jgi:hypothetical protein
MLKPTGIGGLGEHRTESNTNDQGLCDLRSVALCIGQVLCMRRLQSLLVGGGLLSHVCCELCEFICPEDHLGTIMQGLLTMGRCSN